MSAGSVAQPDRQLEIFPRELRLNRVDPSRNMQRYYRMAVEQDLFGGASLIREWGRQGAPCHRMIEPHRDEGEAINALLKLADRKSRKGYVA